MEKHSMHDTVSYPKLIDMYRNFFFDQKHLKSVQDQAKKLEVLRTRSVQQVNNLKRSVIDKLEAVERWMQIKFHEAEKLL